MSSLSYAAFRQAIVGRKQVTCFYQGCYRECCPHVIGTKRGQRHVLTFQFGGQSNSGLPTGGQWRCMDTDAVSEVTLRDGPWHTGSSHLRPQTCVDHVDVEVT